MTLAEGVLGKSYMISAIDTEDEELNGFLFTLGCYPGASIALVSQVGKSFVISVRDGRYNIDKNLAEAIEIG